MKKLYVLMGKSSSGKDSIYKKLLERTELSLKKIVIYTTRPIRDGETQGVEYHFVNDKTKDELKQRDLVIECRDYNTVYGIWSYFTVMDEQFENDDNCLVIGTLEAYEDFRRYFGEEKVCPIYIEVDDGERLTRALAREKTQKQPKYAELCRRFLADEEDFSNDKLAKAGITKRFRNEDLDTCLEEIASFVL